MARYAIRMPGGGIGVRAIPTEAAAVKIAAQVGGKTILDPRSVQR